MADLDGLNGVVAADSNVVDSADAEVDVYAVVLDDEDVAEYEATVSLPGGEIEIDSSFVIAFEDEGLAGGQLLVGFEAIGTSFALYSEVVALVG